MLKKNKSTTEYVTTKHFDKQMKSIDARFDDVDKRFIAIDKRFDDVDKRFIAIDKRFIAIDKRFDEQTGIILDALDTRFSKMESQINDMRYDINFMQTTLESHIKGHADSDQEFVIMKEEMNQVKHVIHKKLGVEIRAF